MRGLGQRLAGAGYTVLGPRLTHHGTKAADMNRSRWQDWYYSALDGWHLLDGLCERVVVIGLSMGGLTALMLAANVPLAGVVGMSTPAAYTYNEWQLKLARYLWWLKPLLRKSADTAEKETWPSYAEYPVRAAAELQLYKKRLTAVVPTVTAPALLLPALNDTTVPYRNLAYIYNNIGSTDKRQVTIEAGGHMMTEGTEKERVYQEVIAFLDSLGP
jgi:carboxylesterase